MSNSSLYARTNDWLQLLIADRRVSLGTLIQPFENLRLQWNPFIEWMPQDGLNRDLIRQILCELIDEKTIRLMNCPVPYDPGTVIRIQGTDAIKVVERSNSELSRDRTYFVEFTEPGASRWEQNRCPDWNHFYECDTKAYLESAVVFELRCMARNRLEQLLKHFCKYYGYCQHRGLDQLIIRHERSWTPRYWKALDYCEVASFLAYPLDEEDRNDESSDLRGLREVFQPWKLNQISHSAK